MYGRIGSLMLCANFRTSVLIIFMLRKDVFNISCYQDSSQSGGSFTVQKGAARVCCTQPVMVTMSHDIN